MFISQGLRYTSAVTSFIGRDGGVLAKKSVLVESLAQRENIRENDSLRGRSQGGWGGTSYVISLRRYRNVQENLRG